MNIETRKLTDIRPYDNNPRKNDQAVEAVAKSLREFGFRQPIVIDCEGVIVVGHTRWKAARQLQLETVPVHVAQDLTPEQARAYRIADNQTAALADWDTQLLPLELIELQSLNVDLDLLSFSPDDLSGYLGQKVEAGLVDPDEVPEPPDEPTTQSGDLWILGDHRLLCGDSGNPQDVDGLLAGQPVHLVSTDPPYNVRVEPRSNNAIAAGNSSFTKTNRQAQHPEIEQAKLRAKDRPLTNDFVSDEVFGELLRA